MNTSGAFAASSVETYQAKPSGTISAPVRLSGRRRHAYSPVPTKLQPTTGSNTALRTRKSTWSLARMTAPTPSRPPARPKATIQARPAVIAAIVAE